MKIRPQYSKYIKALSLGFLIITAAGLVGFGSAYRSVQERRLAASNALTSVLGDTSERVGGLSASVTGVKMVIDEAYVSLSVTNISSQRKELSPGLQIFAVTRAGRELPISGLADFDPYTGGPLESGQSSSGTVIFTLAGDSATKLRVYDGVDRLVYTEIPLSFIQQTPTVQ